MTMNRSCSNSWNHFVWWGRIAEWSMSGLVTTTWPAARTVERIGRRRVPVVGRGRDVQPARGGQLPELGHLVLAERLGREEEQRPRGRILGDGLQDRHGVAQRLARRGRRDDDDVRARVDRLDRLGLVGVRAGDAATREPGDDPRIQPVREVGEVGTACRQDRVMDDAASDGRLLEQAGQDGTGLGGGVGSHVVSLWKRTDVRNAASLADGPSTL